MNERALVLCTLSPCDPPLSCEAAFAFPLLSPSKAELQTGSGDSEGTLSSWGNCVQSRRGLGNNLQSGAGGGSGEGPETQMRQQQWQGSRV